VGAVAAAAAAATTTTKLVTMIGFIPYIILYFVEPFTN
jgi:hypothetical protein